jgi:hypothetical protein
LSHRAPDLTLELHDGGFVSITNKAPAVQTRPEIAGTHRPEGIFLAAGPDIPNGLRLPELSIPDIPCAMLYSLGIPIPVNFEGSLPVGAFEPSLLRTRPVACGEPTRPPLSPDAAGGESVASGYDAAEEALIGDRLRALGYLE